MIAIICQFGLLKVVFSSTSLAAIGFLALAQSLFIFSKLAEAGIGINMTQILSRFIGRGFSAYWECLVAGVLLSVIPTVVIGLALIYPVTLLLGYQDSGLSTATINDMIWIIYFQSSASTLTALIYGLLDGAGQMEKRSLISIIGSVVYFAVGYSAVSSMGILAIPIASLAMFSLTSVLGIMIGSPGMRAVKLFRVRRVKFVLRLALRSSIYLFSISILRMLFEPALKMAASIEAGIEFVALLDIAMKIITYTRTIIQAALQPLLAATSTMLGQRNLSHQASLIHTATLKTTKIGTLIFALVISGSPIFSVIMFEKIENDFLQILAILSVAAMVNVFGIPSYYKLVAQADYRPLLAIHIWMSAGIAIGIVMMLAVSQIWFLVLAYGVAFAFGGMRTYWHANNGYQFHQNKAIWREAVTGWGGLIFMSGLFIALGFWSDNILILFSLAASIALSLLVVYQFDKMRKE